MIDIANLTDADVGRNVTYHREFCNREFGNLTSWNEKFVFVRFKGPNGEACEPDDVSFDSLTDAIMAESAKSPSPVRKDGGGRSA